jgi:glucokinase
VVTSHQVAGWDQFPLVDWCRRELGAAAVLGNDADLAGLAEARYGAGRDYDPVFYITVGTGIGGGLITEGQVYRGSGHGAAEIGHLRPGLTATSAEQTLESLASGPGIVAAALQRLAGLPSANHDLEELRTRAGSNLERLTAQIVAEAASAGNATAQAAWQESLVALGWGIAQVITLVAPAAVVIGGGVPLSGEQLFYEPLRAAVERFVFPPFRGKYKILPPELGEEMVVHGAIALAAGR